MCHKQYEKTYTRPLQHAEASQYTQVPAHQRLGVLVSLLYSLSLPLTYHLSYYYHQQ